MRKIILISLITLGIFQYALLADGTFTVTEGHGYDYAETKTVAYTTNRCSRAYHALKNLLKDEAKEECARQGNYGMKMLKMKKWTKISCTKRKRKGHKTRITVVGSFQAMCHR